jgi:hypothetical protein
MTNKFNKFMKNPLQSLMESKLNVPQEYADNPKGAIDYLLQSGQVSQDKLNNAISMAQRFGVKL